jgi:dTMP kinase
VSRGRLITIEGIDGAGKSTLVAGLTDALAARGRPVVVLREPGGVELSERIRDLVQGAGGWDVSPRAEALLYAAARAQLVAERVEPLLADGQWVLLDRFVDSSLAYQGAGRGLGVEAIRALNAFATGGLTADRTLLLRIDPDAGLARLSARGGAPDRLESEAGEFFATVARAYDELAAAEPDRIAVVDASRPPAEVLAAALAALESLR